MTDPRRTAGVVVPSALMGLAIVVEGLALDRLLPAYVLSLLLSLPMRVFLGVVLIGAGCGMGYAAVQAFRAAGTAVEPWKPSTVLVRSGVYAWLRNPMEVGMILVLMGIAVVLASDWMLVIMVLFLPFIHFLVVIGEERYLAAKFGVPYLNYFATVPRYGWSF